VIVDADRPPLDLLRAVPGVTDAQAFGDRAHVTAATDAAPELPGLLRDAVAAQGLAVQSVRPIMPSLEDVFIGMLEHEARTQ
jgi:ABC-2 type transport system ATP-binding protein